MAFVEVDRKELEVGSVGVPPAVSRIPWWWLPPLAGLFYAATRKKKKPPTAGGV